MYYYTARSVARLFAENGLELVDLMPTDVHGGSMVFFGAAPGTWPVRGIVAATIARERAILGDALLDLMPATLTRWRKETRALIDRFRETGRSVWMYGGSAKAATFINAVGIDERDIRYCADSTPEKIGLFLPGTGIEIRPEDEAIAARPDYYLVTAWNYRNELIQKVRAGGNRHSGFAVPFPEVQVIVTSAADLYEQTAAAAGRSEAAE
jgi:methylation protein EvaC